MELARLRDVLMLFSPASIKVTIKEPEKIDMEGT